MTKNNKTTQTLSFFIAALMALQAVLGLLLSKQYNDPAWIKTAWFGNDLFTLILAVPLLVITSLISQRGSTRGNLFWLGMLGYAVYNYVYYLFGSALNAFLLLYILILNLSIITIILGISDLDVNKTASKLSEKTPRKFLGGFFAFVGIGLAIVWIMMWAAHIFGGKPTPIEPEPFKVVAAIDISIIAPMLLFGGIMLWKKNAWGTVIASMAGVLGSLYLLLLSTNSVIAIQRGLAEAPGELPIWGSLGALTSLATFFLFRNIKEK